MLRDVPDVVGARVYSPIETSDHSAVFIDVVLEQLILHLVCRQEVYLKYSRDWGMVGGAVKGLNYSRIIMSLSRYYPLAHRTRKKDTSYKPERSQSNDIRLSYRTAKQDRNKEWKKITMNKN